MARFALAAVDAASSTSVDQDDQSRGKVTIRVGICTGPVTIYPLLQHLIQICSSCSPELSLGFELLQATATVIGTSQLKYTLLGTRQ